MAQVRLIIVPHPMDIVIGLMSSHVTQGGPMSISLILFLNRARGVTFSSFQIIGCKDVGLVNISYCFPTGLIESVSAGENWAD